MKIVSIILARGDSKGIPNKNMICFCDFPLLYYAMLNSLDSRLIDETYVSTDSEVILDYASKFGAKVIVRPEELCQDKSTSESGWQHALKLVGDCDIIVATQVTSPLCESSDIDSAITKFIENKYDSLFSASLANDTFIWKGEDSITYDYKNRQRRQDCSDYVVENGAFWIFKPEILIKENNRLGGKIGYFLMEDWKKYEIDEPIDIKICETIYKEKIYEKGLD